MTEAEYSRSLIWLRGEIDSALRIYHISEEMNQLALSDKDVYRHLNDEAGFWLVNSGCLQTSLFIILGRIFDTDPSANSIRTVIRNTVNHVEFFSEEALRLRKSGLSSEDLETYMEDVWIPTKEALQRLKPGVAKYQKVFDKKYAPLRNKVYAHSEFSDEHAYPLFTETKKNEVEEMLIYLLVVTDGIIALYNNGREPSLEVSYRDGRYSFIRDSVGRVLRPRVIGL